MTRLQITSFKSVGAIIASFAMYMLQIVNEAIVVLVFFMLLDMITGVMRSFLTKSWNSTVGMSGIIKKVAIFVLIGMAGAVEYVALSAGQDSKGLVILGVTSFFIVNECISILEKTAQIGLPIPPILYNVLEKLHKDPTGKEMRIVRGSAEGHSIFIYPGSTTSKKLAECVAEFLKQGTTQKWRGIKEQNFHVLRETKMPAILSENGFMDNPREARLMLDANFQKEVAREHVLGICKYFGVIYKEKEEVKGVDKTNQTVSETHATAWKWVKEKGYLNGENPKNPIAREQLATVIKRLHDDLKK